jgi:DNA-binding transcriptional ArsR family regulator
MIELSRGSQQGRVTKAGMTELEALPHPERAEIQIQEVLKALAEPARLEIVRLLDKHGRVAVACGEIDTGLTKQNLTHHLRTLREAGVVRTEPIGRRRFTTLRREDLDARFPGLLDGILAGLKA